MAEKENDQQDKSAYSAEDIEVFDMRTMMQKRLIEPAHVDLIYVIIGYLQEYMGGYQRDAAIVDRFFVNEQEKAALFEKICTRYLEEKGAENDVRLEKQAKGFSMVYSPTICKALESHYSIEAPPFLAHHCTNLSPDDPIFKSARELG
ncbi:MAG: hypothetical protein AAF570_10820, partial [Bacteroidota bacterium]